MRKLVKQFVELTARCLPLRDTIYEFGALQVPGQEGFADLRPIFSGLAYVGADMRAGPGVDEILNLHNIDLSSDSVGSVLCLDTLEHVEYPRQALQEIYRVLSPKWGTVVISSVMDFPIHDYPHDYWRFTPAAFTSLLKPFRYSIVGWAGNTSLPHTVVGVGFKGDVPDLSAFREQYRKWQQMQRYDVRQVVRQLTPPALLPAVSVLAGWLDRLVSEVRHDA